MLLLKVTLCNKCNLKSKNIKIKLNMSNQVTVQMILNSWNSTIEQANSIFEKISDEDFLKEIAPNKNSGAYLLGHLVGVHDRMLPVLGIGEPLYPVLLDVFLRKADDKTNGGLSVKDLRAYWLELNEILSTHFKTYSTENWFQKHTSVTDEDFAKEPHRNKLNILISRTNHLSYHLGQIALLKK